MRARLHAGGPTQCSTSRTARASVPPAPRCGGARETPVRHRFLPALARQATSLWSAVTCSASPAGGGGPPGRWPSGFRPRPIVDWQDPLTGRVRDAEAPLPGVEAHAQHVQGDRGLRDQAEVRVHHQGRRGYSEAWPVPGVAQAGGCAKNGPRQGPRRALPAVPWRFGGAARCARTSKAGSERAPI